LKTLYPNNIVSVKTNDNQSHKLIRNLWLFFAGIIIWIAWNSSLSFSEEMIIGLSISILSILPALIWLSSNNRELPAFQLFCITHLFYYGYPILNGNSEYMTFKEESRLLAAYNILVFLLLVLSIYYYKGQVRKTTKHLPDFLLREIPAGLALNLFNIGVFLWLCIVSARQFGLLALAGSYINLLWTIGNVFGSLSLYFLYQKSGAGMLRKTNLIFVNFCLFFSILISFSSGLLVHGTSFLIISIMGYVIGKKKIPLVTIILCAIVIGFLHAGKAEMRNKFWNNPSPNNITKVLKVYEYWFPASLSAISKGLDSELGSRSLLNRLSLIHIQTRVIELTPAYRPYLNGETYFDIPTLLIPRFLWPNKPSGHLSTEKLGLYYGVHTLESVKFTSIGFGKLAEAWANFGWFGIFLLALFYGFTMRYMAKACYNKNQESLITFTGILWLGYSFQIESSMSSSIVVFIQAFITMILALHLFLLKKNN